MADKGARAVISVATNWDDRAVIQAEADRTGDNLSVTVMRLAKLGLEHQARTAGDGTDGRGGVPGPDASVPLLTAAAGAAGATAVIAVPGPDGIMPAVRSQPAPEPVLVEAAPSFRHQGASRRWTATEAVAPVPFDDRARWAAVGVLSLLLALMLVPGDGMIAAGVSQAVLGRPGDGVAASNQLFEHFSHRAGPLRYLEATTRLLDNRARVRACADRADRLADYRNLATCELHVPSRRRAIEVGQGLVD